MRIVLVFVVAGLVFISCVPTDPDEAPTPTATSPFSSSGEYACRRFDRFSSDASAGILTPAEQRTALQKIDTLAGGADEAPIRAASRAMLRALTQAMAGAITEAGVGDYAAAIRAMTAACHPNGSKTTDTEQATGQVHTGDRVRT